MLIFAVADPIDGAGPARPQGQVRTRATTPNPKARRRLFFIGSRCLRVHCRPHLLIVDPSLSLACYRALRERLGLVVALGFVASDSIFLAVDDLAVRTWRCSNLSVSSIPSARHPKRKRNPNGGRHCATRKRNPHGRRRKRSPQRWCGKKSSQSITKRPFFRFDSRGHGRRKPPPPVPFLVMAVFFCFNGKGSFPPRKIRSLR